MAQKIGREYWERNWQNVGLPRVVEPERDTVRDHSYHEFHRFFSEHLQPQQGRRLVEFGCAQSAWLAYFARCYGLDVTGIDYSPVGCQQASAILLREGVAGRIVHANFMEPPTHLLGAYDIGVSFGVVEHFEDTTECLVALRQFLKPGGILITAIPNLAGWVGMLQKHLDRTIHDIHVVLDDIALADAHRRADLQVVECRYLVCSNFGVINVSDSVYPFARFRRLVRLALMGCSAALWLIHRYVLPLPASRLLSPYVICLARVPS